MWSVELEEVITVSQSSKRVISIESEAASYPVTGSRCQEQMCWVSRPPLFTVMSCCCLKVQAVGRYMVGWCSLPNQWTESNLDNPPHPFLPPWLSIFCCCCFKCTFHLSRFILLVSVTHDWVLQLNAGVCGRAADTEKQQQQNRNLSLCNTMWRWQLINSVIFNQKPSTLPSKIKLVWNSKKRELLK